MPGVGKTQLALKYAERYRPDYAAGLWVSAASRDTLQSGFAALAEVLNLPERNEADQAKVVAAVQRWLNTTNQTWMLILDNADELKELHGFLPSGRGHCLLTTRPKGVRALATPVEVREMLPDVGALLLLRRAGRLQQGQPLDDARAEDRKSAIDLATELGSLPLALDQAGAYVEEIGVSLARYLDLYQTEGKRLRAERGDIDLDHVSVTITFNLAFAQVAQRNPVAVELLRACAFLHPDAIPEELLIESALEWGEPLAAALADSERCDQLFRVLNRFSLIARDPDTHTLTLHRVVQAVLRDELEEASQRRWAERAVRAVNRGFPDPEEFSAWPQCERLLSQAQVAAAWIERWDFAFAEGGCLLKDAAYYLKGRGRYADAEPLQQHALAISERVLGPDHPAVATYLNNLAWLYHVQGRWAETEPLYRCALALRERALGPDHPDVAASINNLAVLYCAQGRYADAEPLHQRALALRERALGPDHPDVAQSLNNLARLYHIQGRYAEVEPLLQRAIAIWERTDHPDVATGLDNLANLYRKQGRWAEAEPLYQHSLAISERDFGPDHPNVATPLNNLANLYRDQGRTAEAEPLYQRCLTIQGRTVHPNAALNLENYATLLEQTGRAAEAAPLRERAQAIRDRHAQANPSTS